MPKGSRRWRRRRAATVAGSIGEWFVTPAPRRRTTRARAACREGDRVPRSPEGREHECPPRAHRAGRRALLGALRPHRARALPAAPRAAAPQPWPVRPPPCARRRSRSRFPVARARERETNRRRAGEDEPIVGPPGEGTVERTPVGWFAHGNRGVGDWFSTRRPKRRHQGVGLLRRTRHEDAPAVEGTRRGSRFDDSLPAWVGASVLVQREAVSSARMLLALAGGRRRGWQRVQDGRREGRCRGRPERSRHGDHRHDRPAPLVSGRARHHAATNRRAASCTGSTSTPTPGCCSSSTRRRPLVFWMKNTLIPLDMIFIGADRRIVGIVENAEPQTRDARRVEGLSQYVLEIGGGLRRSSGSGLASRCRSRAIPLAVTGGACGRCWRRWPTRRSAIPISFTSRSTTASARSSRSPPGAGAAAEVAIASRLGNDKTAQFPEIVAALARWGGRAAPVGLLDGEIVALDDGGPAGGLSAAAGPHAPAGEGATSNGAPSAAPAALVAFDLLRDGDEDLVPAAADGAAARLEEALALDGGGRLPAGARRSPATGAR